MWIITTRGFLSVVQNADAKTPHEALLVRARVREDLDRFADFVARHGDRPAVTATPRFDYGYRLTTSRQIFAAYLAECVGALDYPNFKNEVADADPERAHIYTRVWGVLRDLCKIGLKDESKRTARIKPTALDILTKAYGYSTHSLTPTILSRSLMSENVAAELSEGAGLMNQPIFGVTVVVMRPDGSVYRAGDVYGAPIRSAIFYSRAAAEAHIAEMRERLRCDGLSVHERAIT